MVGHKISCFDISIYYGIKTGYNDAFIIDTALRDRLISEDPSSADLLKPILRGRDIARYRANWAGLWLISTFPSLNLDIDTFPAIKRHLLSFGKDRLAQEGRRLPSGGNSRKKTPNAWYELQDTCAYHEDFERNKVIWIELVDEGRFAFDESGTFIEATAFMLTGKETKPLCALLNSSIARWYIRKNAPTSGLGTLRWKKVYVESIPLVKSKLELISLGILVDKAKLCNDYNKILSIEEDIDSIVCHSYGFSTAEIDVIKSTRRVPFKLREARFTRWI